MMRKAGGATSGIVESAAIKGREKGKMSENAIVGAIVVACLVYVVARARRAFKSGGCGCGCGTGGEKKGCGCAGCNGCNGCDGGENAKSTERGCGRSE